MSDEQAALRDVTEWWDHLPSTLRQDIEGSGNEPGCIARARRLSAAPAAPASGAVHRIEGLIAACKKDASKHWENIPRRDAALMKAACYEVARDEVLAAAPTGGALPAEVRSAILAVLHHWVPDSAEQSKVLRKYLDAAPAGGAEQLSEELLAAYEAAKALDVWLVAKAAEDARQDARTDYRFYMDSLAAKLDIAIQRVEDARRDKPAPAAPASGAGQTHDGSQSVNDTLPTGTFACPICAWSEPHSHTQEEIAERPLIDGARAAFEKEAREFMASEQFKGPRTGYWWGLPAQFARTTEQGKYHGWAQRHYATGPYSNEFVEIMWQFWRIAWISARRASPAPPGWEEAREACANVADEIASRARKAGVPSSEDVWVLDIMTAERVAFEIRSLPAPSVLDKS